MSTKLLENLGDRVLVEVAHQALRVALELTHDPDLGLRAARRQVIGDVGAFYYVVSSSPTVRDALDRASRYIHLINDALDVSIQWDDDVVVRLENSVVLPRAAVDFQAGSFFNNHLRGWFGERISAVAVYFAHQVPERLSEYVRTFAPATVHFSAPFAGFSFDKALLELRLPTADPNLHAVTAAIADQMLGKMARANSVTADVRRSIHERLALGTPEITDVAAEFGTSTRTLARRLEREGTTFRGLVDDVRRELALDCIARHDTGMSELSCRLGYSYVGAFHRAFRRWTGQTPLTYRRMAGR